MDYTECFNGKSSNKSHFIPRTRLNFYLGNHHCFTKQYGKYVSFIWEIFSILATIFCRLLDQNIGRHDSWRIFSRIKPNVKVICALSKLMETLLLRLWTISQEQEHLCTSILLKTRSWINASLFLGLYKKVNIKLTHTCTLPSPTQVCD